MNHSETDTNVRIGRLDMSDWVDLEADDEEQLASLPVCDWCGEPRGKEYMVLDQDQCDALCTHCWGQAATYQTLREQGLSRTAILEGMGKKSPDTARVYS